MKKPNKIQIRELVKNDNFKWFLERMATYLNGIDTVRNVENGEELVARQKVIEIIEDAFADVFDVGELAELQKKVAEDEENIIKRIQNITEEY